MRYVVYMVIILSTSSCYYFNKEELYELDECIIDNMSYSNDISPIMKTYCNICHNKDNKSGGVRTDGYEELKIIANNKKLLGSIKHLDGYSGMPRNSEPLSDCNISKIEAWIEQGMVNVK